jgi:putative FmdB family regulatory protein
MPLFGFTCEECEHDFEELVRSAAAVDEVICPDCGSPQVRKQMSRVARLKSVGSASSFSPAPAPACSPGGT